MAAHQTIQQAFVSYRKQIHDHPDGGEQLVKCYDEWAEKQENFMSELNYQGPANLAAISSDLISDKSSRILDAASGTGRVGEELNVLGFTSIDALDPSQKSLDCCKRCQVYTEYICDTLGEHQTKIADVKYTVTYINGSKWIAADFKKSIVPNTDRYDAVVMCGAMGIPGHVTDACFPELIRVTKPGGYIMFTVSEKHLDKWDGLEAAIQAINQQGLWEVVEYRWVPYLGIEAETEKAKVPVLRVLKKHHKAKDNSL